MKARTKATATALAALATSVTVGVVAPTAAGAAGCSTRWGSTPEQVSAMSADAVTGVRSGRHTCFDRLVVDVDGDVAGYDVRYVPQVVADGSGAVVPTRGGARLSVTVRAPAYDDDGDATYRPPSRSRVVGVDGYRTFRQVTWAGTFEGQTTLGLGVRARLPFRVLVLDGPGDRSRLVVDVAHRW